jgi:hypothetical protein
VPEVQVQPATFQPPPVDLNGEQPSPSPDGSAGENPPPQAASPSVEPGPEGGEPPGAGLLKDSLFEKWGQELGRWESQWPVSLTGGADNWWHVNNDGPLVSGYGVPCVPGKLLTEGPTRTGAP